MMPQVVPHVHATSDKRGKLQTRSRSSSCKMQHNQTLSPSKKRQVSACLAAAVTPDLSHSLCRNAVHVHTLEAVIIGEQVLENARREERREKSA